MTSRLQMNPSLSYFYDCSSQYAQLDKHRVVTLKKIECLWNKTMYERASNIRTVLHNFWLTNFSILFAVDYQANPTALTSAAKSNEKIGQSKVMQHCS